MITPYAALAAFLALCFSKECRSCASPLTLGTAFSLLFYMNHHFMFAVFVTIDSFIALLLFKYTTTQSRAIMCLCLCSMITNIYGFNLYYHYMVMDNYNFIMQCIIIMQVLCIWMMRNDRLDFVHIIFRASRSNSN